MPLGRAIHGSVADRLVRESPKPVVLVPPRANYLGGRNVTLRRVLVPLDGSAAALRVIPRLLALPRANMLELVLLQVVQPDSRLRARGSQAEVRVIESRDPGTVIINAVRNDLVELIAMSTRGASGLQRLVPGSVAEYVVRRSEIPVLLVTARSGAAVALSA